MMELGRGHWIHSVLLKELTLTMVWWITRDFRSRNCILENPRTRWNFKDGNSISRLNYVQIQQFLTSLCTGSKKLKKQSQWTILWHRDRLQGQQMSSTTICLMRWLRLQWGSFPRMCTSEKSMCRRANCSEIRPILTREANYIHDLWAFSSHRSLWSCAMSIGSVQYTLEERWCSRFRHKNGTKLC